MQWRAIAMSGVGVAVLAIPSPADACTCRWGASPLGAADARPANARIAFASCVDEFPSEMLSATIDDEPATLVIDDRSTGPYTLLLGLDPQPVPGQRVVLELCADDPEACRDGVSETFEWVAGEPDHDAPTASVASISATRDVDDPSGLDCPPDGELFRVRFRDVELQPDTAALWLEVIVESATHDGVVYAVDPADLPDDFEVQIYAATDADSCIQAWTLDAAGNATRLGDPICDIRRAESPPEMDDVEAVDASCGCVAGGEGATPLGWMFVLLAITVARPRPRKVPVPDEQR